MNSSLSKLTLPEVTSPEVAWSELPFPELPAYEFGYPEFNPMSSSLPETALPEFASPISHWRYNQRDRFTWWKAAIWECRPYTNIPRLPPELTDRIISFAGDNPNFSITKQRMLYNCALVCHAWLPASLYQLFSQDLLGINTNSFEALVRASRTPSYHSAAALRVVRAITLIDAQPTWVYRFPLVLGQMFSAVQELCIQYLKWGKVVIHPYTLLIGFGQFGCVTKVELRNCTFRNFCQFRHLICALPRLQILRVVDSALKRCETLPTAHAASPFPAFTRLVVKTGDDETQLALSSALFGWLTLMPASIHCLQKLETFLKRHILSSLRNFLMHAGTSLEDLNSDFYYATESDVQDLNIGQCTALHKLTLRRVKSMSLAEILRIISPNCHLQKLDILMMPREVDCEWESAARIMDEQQFLTLREFRLDVRGKDLAEEEKRRISDCFDALRRRGVKVMLSFGYPWFNFVPLEPYHSDSLTVSARQSKTPELQVEDVQLSGVPLTSNDDEHQSSI